MLIEVIVEALGKLESKRRHRREKQRQQNQSSLDRTSMPLAYALARSWAWPALQFRCQTHPLEVAQLATDDRGETLLHWTCIGKPPIETVQAILDACPEMAQVRNKTGHLPLHVAIGYRASAEVVRALVRAFPESAGLPNGVGNYPVHIICDYGTSVDSLRAVLETPAGAATVDRPTRDARQLKPLSILNSRMDSTFFARSILSMKEARRRRQELTAAGREDGDGNELMLSSFQRKDYWQKASLLVLVSYTRKPLSPQGLDAEEANLVHACAGVPDCPSYLLEFAMLLHMEDLIQKKDSQGRLPLHVAAQSHARSLSSSHEKRRQRSEGSLRLILQACPAAAHVKDANGDLPLVLALAEIRQQVRGPQGGAAKRSVWSRGLQQLLDANVAALQTMNLLDGLYPYAWSLRMTSVNLLFESVRRHPHLFLPSSGAVRPGQMGHSRNGRTVTV